MHLFFRQKNKNDVCLLRRRRQQGKRMEILGSNPMFPPCARKSVSSLYTCAMRSTAKMVSAFCAGPGCDLGQGHAATSGVASVRRYTRKHLPAFILTDLLSTIVPAATDRWR